jgi:hypothetical protein
MILLSALTGGLSIFNIAQRVLGFGLAPLMKAVLEFYRALLHPLVEVIVAITYWVAAIPFIDNLVQMAITYWKWFWAATLVYVLQLLLPASWFHWIAATYYYLLDSLFGMPGQLFRDLFILSFLVMVPLFRAVEAEDRDQLMPEPNPSFLVFSLIAAVLLSLALLGLPIAAVVIAASFFGNWGFLFKYLFHLSLMALAATAYYVLNAQGY